MKRFHVHVTVSNLEDNIRFYSSIFGVQPTVLKTDYAKWMLDDPRVNFAISARGAAPGVNHLGIQVEDDTELEEVHARLLTADRPIVEESQTACCYARSDKYWVKDPQGIAWETFHTLGDVPVFGEGEREEEQPGAATRRAVPLRAACCAPASK